MLSFHKRSKLVTFPTTKLTSYSAIKPAGAEHTSNKISKIRAPVTRAKKKTLNTLTLTFKSIIAYQKFAIMWKERGSSDRFS